MGATVSSNAVEIHGLTKKRTAFALDNLSVRIPTGYITGLVGPNGAGKTSLIKVILGLIAADAGEVALFGREPGVTTAALDRIGVVLDRITAAGEWRAASVGRRVARLYAQWDEPYFQALLRRFDVPAGNRIDMLSRGETVKLSLAMALAHHPDLLILDEPSSGLDPVARRELGDVLREFMVDPTHTVLFSTHITADLDNLADFIVVLAEGKVAYSGAIDELHEQFAIVRGPGPLPESVRRSVIGLLLEPGGGYEGLIRAEDTASFGKETIIDAATIDDVVVHFAADDRSRRPMKSRESEAAPDTREMPASAETETRA